MGCGSRRCPRAETPGGYRATHSKFKRANLLSFLIEAKGCDKRIAGYGAPGKGNTLLNYCGIRTDFLDYTVDRNPYKHGKYLPGTHIPIFPPEKITETKPDYVLILPAGSLLAFRRWIGRQGVT
jgi:hypothetical protein